MKKILKLGGLILVIIVFGVVMVLGYLGFVPGLSSVFGSDKARDLGIEFTEQQCGVVSCRGDDYGVEGVMRAVGQREEKGGC